MLKGEEKVWYAAFRTKNPRFELTPESWTVI